MGLQITKIHPRYGLDLEYWKVGEIKINWHEETCRASLLGFVNQEQRNAGKDHVQEIVFTYNGVNFTFTHATGIVTQLYLKIKADEEWSSAVDVLE